METTDHTPTGAFDLMVSAKVAEPVAASTGAGEPRGAVPAPPVRPASAGILGLGLAGSVPVVVPRRSLLDGISLGLAIVAGPVGLIVGIVAAILSRRRLGYVSGIARAAIAVSIVMSVILAGGGVAYSFVARAQAHEDALRASSAGLCAMIAAAPGRLADPGFGWPAFTTTIPDYIRDVDVYAAWWSKLAVIAPAPMRGQVSALARVATASSDRMATSKVIEHDQDYADMQKAAAVSTLPVWVGTYCR
jgi:hypothetical protein